VITGEGSLDRQTLEGKTPVGVARLARKLGKRVFAIVGRATNDPEVREVFDAVYENARSGMSQEENMKRRRGTVARERARTCQRTVGVLIARSRSLALTSCLSISLPPPRAPFCEPRKFSGLTQTPYKISRILRATSLRSSDRRQDSHS